MAAAFVQGTGTQSSGSVASIAKAFTSNVTAGNSIIAMPDSPNTAWPTNGVSDSLGNGGGYTRDVNHAPGATFGANLAIYRVHNIAGGACTVTADCGTDFMSLVIAEFSGLNNAPPTNSATAGPTTGTAVNSGSLGAAASAGLCIGVMSQDGATITITPGGTFNEIFEAENGSNQPINGEYKIVAAGTYSADWTLASSANWHAAAAFYADSAGAATTTDLPTPPAVIPNRFVGPMALRQAKHSPAPFDTAVAAPTDSEFGTRVRIPNPCVGPMALRQIWRAPPTLDTTQAAPTNVEYGSGIIIPNPRVGPMALRVRYRGQAQKFDTTVAPPSTGNRLRRVICSASDS